MLCILNIRLNFDVKPSKLKTFCLKSVMVSKTFTFFSIIFLANSFWKSKKNCSNHQMHCDFFTTLALHNILKGLKLLYEGVVTTRKDKKIPTLCLHENE